MEKYLRNASTSFIFYVRNDFEKTRLYGKQLLFAAAFSHFVPLIGISVVVRASALHGWAVSNTQRKKCICSKQLFISLLKIVFYFEFFFCFFCFCCALHFRIVNCFWFAEINEPAADTIAFICNDIPYIEQSQNPLPLNSIYNYIKAIKFVFNDFQIKL